MAESINIEYEHGFIQSHRKNEEGVHRKVVSFPLIENPITKLISNRVLHHEF
jgi:hypothetical protein